MKKCTFIIGTLLAGVYLSAAEVDVNGKFMKLNPNDSTKVDGWGKAWANMKDIGEVAITDGSADDRKAVRITTTSLFTPYTSVVWIPAKTGEVITVSFDAKGSGRISGCFYIHGPMPKREYFGRFNNPNQPVTEEFKRYEFSYTVPAEYEKKGVPGDVRPGLCVYANSDITIENVRVETK